VPIEEEEEEEAELSDMIKNVHFPSCKVPVMLVRF
jgi:hypothetical protein